MAILRERQTWTRSRVGRRHERLDRLSDEEAQRVKVALRALHDRHGSWSWIANRMRVPLDTIKKMASRGRRPTAGAAIKVARLAGVSVEDVLSGRFPRAGSRRGGTGRYGARRG